MNPAGIAIILVGLFALCGAVFDWEFFMGSRKAQLFVSLLGRNGARIVYGILGVGLCVLGALLTAGIVD